MPIGAATPETLAEYGPRAAEDFGFDPAVCLGVFVGGCVERGVGSVFYAKAHAHTRPGEHTFAVHRPPKDWSGWICVRSHRRLFAANGGPSLLMLHEYVHLLLPREAHGPEWRAAMRRLGYPNEAARYKRGTHHPDGDWPIPAGVEAELTRVRPEGKGRPRDARAARPK